MGELVCKGVAIGRGRTKTVVSLMGADQGELLEAAAAAVAAGADCLEWRADLFGRLEDHGRLCAAAGALAETLPSTPLIFTFRSRGQGGQGELSPVAYEQLNRAIIEDGSADLVDVELGLGDERVAALVSRAHGRGLRAIVSHHDLAGTPDEGWMVGQLAHMAELGADIPKLAVMARSRDDCHALMRATSRAREQLDVPLLTMAMGAMGENSRLSGEAFGSALTFCALGRPSAPGQVGLAEALPVLEALHRVLEAQASA